MMKLLYLFAAIFGQISCEDLSTKIKLICPNGWLAKDLFSYLNKESHTQDATCLLCQKNSVVSLPYKFLEICVSNQTDLFNSSQTVQNAYLQMKHPCMADLLFGWIGLGRPSKYLNLLLSNTQSNWIQTGKTGGQMSSDTSP